MTMITPSYLGETIEYSSLHACRSTLEDPRTKAWADLARKAQQELEGIQSEIDDLCFSLYQISERDRHGMTNGFGSHFEQSNDDRDAGRDGDTEEQGVEFEASSLASELVLWMIAAAFGRFDIRYATGASSLPNHPEPFSPFPPRSAGMLVGEDGMPLKSTPDQYPLELPESGMLVDDPGHPLDLTAAVRKIFSLMFGEHADAFWNEIEQLLAPKGKDLRAWISANAFERHLKLYSKSRRKAPVVWQLGLPSGRYSVWLYAHRLSRDIIIQIENDITGPKVAHEERQLTSLIESAGKDPTSRDAGEIEAQRAFVGELREMLDEVKRAAHVWHPALDDGIVLAMAPLLRLVPQNRGWQRELAAKWRELVGGGYEWAKLAMHLWPERVIPLCATDRSLAISHGLEGNFWFENEDGKWESYEVPKKSIAALTRERTSIAVKAALKGLIEAPVAIGGTRRTRRATAA